MDRPQLDLSLPPFKVIRRNGSVVDFNPGKIAVAMSKAFLAVEGGHGASSTRVRDVVGKLTEVVVAALARRKPDGGTIHIEDIQDQVELALMRGGEQEVARAYVLYREKRASERALEAPRSAPELHVEVDGRREPLERERLVRIVEEACIGLADVAVTPVVDAAMRDLYDGIPLGEVHKALVLAARALIEREPGYNYVTARLQLHQIRLEVLGEEVAQSDMAARYADAFPAYVKIGVEAGLLDPRLAQFDLARISAALDASRDLQFGYLGLDRKSVV